jgi:hypothetical protein
LDNDWIKFRDTSVSFPDDPMTLGRWLGLSTDIGPAITAKCLKANGQIMHRSTYRTLAPDEIANPDEIKEIDAFDINITDKLGEISSAIDFIGTDVETPT